MPPTFDFDRVIDRRSVDNLNKWTFFPPDVLPFWLADMDFLTPRPILDAVRRALDHGILGYERASPSLFELVAARLRGLYGWEVDPQRIVAIPSVSAGIRAAASVACQPGEGVLSQPPVFPQFIHFPAEYGLACQYAPLQRVTDGQNIRYEVDPRDFRQAIHAGGAKTSMFLLCNPHNPVGHIFSRDELAWMAEACLENDITICSDEIHSQLLLDGSTFTPIASLSPRVAERTITLIGPGKTFNMSGLACAFAIIPNAGLCQRFSAEMERQMLEVNSLGLAAARAAYSGACDDWLAALLSYLTANRAFLVDFLASELPRLRTTIPDGTYLAWIDCGEFVAGGKITGAPEQFFLEQGKLAFSGGEAYGPGGENFIRMNFACPRSTLEAGLLRMKQALLA